MQVKARARFGIPKATLISNRHFLRAVEFRHRMVGTLAVNFSGRQHIMGLFRTAGRAAVAGSVVGRVQRKQQLKFAAEDAAAANAAPAAQQFAAPVAAPSVPPASMDFTDHKLAQLKQLGELRVAGVLTEAEFEGEKAKILAL